MSEQSVKVDTERPVRKKRQSMFIMTLRRLAKNKLAVLGLVVLVLMIAIAFLSPIISPYPFEQTDLYNTFGTPSKDHLFGTDELGRDILSRLMVGTKYSLRIGLLSVGGEDVKGNDLTKEVFKILSRMPINFVGNVEGHDIFHKNTCDVIVCDGFTGNSLLKASEGLARATFHWLKEAFTKNPIRQTGAFLAKEAFRELKQISDSEEFGGAPLLGIRGVCIIGHGASTPKAVKNAIRLADTYLAAGLTDRIVKRINECGIAVKHG